VEPGPWRDDRRLVIGPETVLPDRCIKTNRPVHGRRLELTLRWHHPAIYLLLLANLVAYIIASELLSKKMTLSVGVSKPVLFIRLAWILATFSLLLFGVAAVLAPIVVHPHPSSMAGLVPLFLSGLAYLWGVRLVSVTRMDDGGYVWLKGVNRKYLAALPEWHEEVAGEHAAPPNNGIQSDNTPPVR
jgi:hypothetical protein